MATTIRFPFSINQSGRVESTVDPNVILAQRVLSALATRYGERVMSGGYGSLIPEHIFGDDLNVGNGIEPEVLIAQEAALALARWANDVRVTDVSVEPSTRVGEYYLNIWYSDDRTGADLKTSIVVNRDLLAGS